MGEGAGGGGVRGAGAGAAQGASQPVPAGWGEHRSWRARVKGEVLRRAQRLAADLAPVAGGGDRADERSGIGDSQWRALSAAAQEAAVPDEVKALIAYKIGKDIDSRGRDGPWARVMRGGDGSRRTGDVCLAAVDDVLAYALEQAERAGVPAEDRDARCLDALALFFGYVAWAVVARRAPRQTAPTPARGGDGMAATGGGAR